MTEPTYLITGIAGFIGSNLARALLARGAKVRGIDNFSSGTQANLHDLGAADVIEGDLTEPQVCAKAMVGVDYVLHHGAMASVPQATQQPDKAHRTNAGGTLCVLEAARQAQTVRRVVYAGSSSAYGNEPTLPKHEGLAPQAVSPYAATKLAGEMYMQAYTHTYTLPCVILRYFNVYGPYQDPNSAYSGVIAKFSHAARNALPPIIYGDGQQSRDFVYVSDVVAANLAACTAPLAAGQIFNIGSGQRTTLLELLNTVGEISGKPQAPRFAPARQGDVRESWAAIDKAREYLDFSPSVPLATGLRHTLAWETTVAPTV